MSEELIREIANQIIHEQILTNWMFYIVLIALAVITSALSAYSASFLRKRGEAHAFKADFDDFIKHLQETTSASEKVKTDIAHAEWSSREWKTIRRMKLEELLTTTYEIISQIQNDVANKLAINPSNITIVDSALFWRLMMLIQLYFPDMKEEAAKIKVSYFEYHNWLLRAQSEIISAGNNLNMKLTINEKATQNNQALQTLLSTIGHIQEKAQEFMNEMFSNK